jgi:F0F1-type ATP synthase membrane subunit b/b'
MLLGSSSLIKVVPGLMIWTLVCFAITFYVLKRYAFGRIQTAINERREKIRQSLDEADAEAEGDRLALLDLRRCCREKGEDGAHRFPP